MKIIDLAPVEILKPFIKTYRIIESEEELNNKVLPNTSIALAFRLKGLNSYTTEYGHLNIAGITLSGLRKSVRDIKYTTETATLIVLFKECGASVFFKEPINEFFEQSISLDRIIAQSELQLIQELLFKSQTNSQKIAIVDQFLTQKLNLTKQDWLVLEAVSRIKSANGLIRIKELANALFISNDAFEKRFRKAVGATPKQFSSIVQLSSIVRKKSNERLLDLAFNGGYYDQAHFNKEFKIFTGQTPSDFYKSASFW